MACKDKITVTIPRDLSLSLPGDPDLIIDLPTTTQAAKVGGYIDRFEPHCVNHLKIGNLGDLEILLIGCDDGDVLAYYTHILRIEGMNEYNGVVRRLSKTRPYV